MKAASPTATTASAAMAHLRYGGAALSVVSTGSPGAATTGAGGGTNVCGVANGASGTKAFTGFALVLDGDERFEGVATDGAATDGAATDGGVSGRGVTDEGVAAEGVTEGAIAGAALDAVTGGAVTDGAVTDGAVTDGGRAASETAAGFGSSRATRRGGVVRGSGAASISARAPGPAAASACVSPFSASDAEAYPGTSSCNARRSQVRNGVISSDGVRAAEAFVTNSSTSASSR